MKEKTLSLPKKTSKWARITRDKFLTMGHFFDHQSPARKTPKKYGKFQPFEMGKGKNVNKYHCLEVKNTTRGKAPRKYWFDMGYVQRILLKECFPLDTLSSIYS